MMKRESSDDIDITYKVSSRENIYPIEIRNTENDSEVFINYIENFKQYKKGVHKKKNVFIVIALILYVVTMIFIIVYFNLYKNLGWAIVILFCYAILVSKFAEIYFNSKLRKHTCPHNIIGGYISKKCPECSEEIKKIDEEEKEISEREKERRLNDLKNSLPTKSYSALNYKKSKGKLSYSKASKSESPIEELFYVKLKENTLEEDFKLIEQQLKIDRYRVDFAIPQKSIVVELDGHDSHKTKKQRTNDAQRERYLQQNGWYVIRYTGSEIKTDIQRCLKDFYSITKLRRKT